MSSTPAYRTVDCPSCQVPMKLVAVIPAASDAESSAGDLAADGEALTATGCDLSAEWEQATSEVSAKTSVSTMPVERRERAGLAVDCDGTFATLTGDPPVGAVHCDEPHVRSARTVQCRSMRQTARQHIHCGSIRLPKPRPRSSEF